MFSHLFHFTLYELIHINRPIFAKTWQAIRKHVFASRSLSRDPVTLPVKVNACIKSGEGRFIIADIEIGEEKLLLVNLYAPNKDDPQFFQEVFHKIESFPTELKIIGGDFNLTLNEQIDRKTRSKYIKQSKASQLVYTFLEETNWIDVWRVLHPQERQFTWRRKHPLTMSRLDYFMLPQEYITQIAECEITPGLLSDHSYVEIQINFHNNIKGRGYWKMNIFLLENSKYVNEINALISKSLENNKHQNPSMCWEILKLEIAEFSQHFGRKTANENKTKRQTLENKLRTHKPKIGKSS